MAIRTTLGLRSSLFPSLLLFALAGTAFAALGGDISSIQADQAHMRAALRISNGPGYTVHEMQQQNGPTVREYVSPAGRVFAVTWQGPSMPDLRQVLGDYYQQFIQAAEQRTRRGRGPLVIQLPGLVVQSGGHMGALAGRAYLVDQLPAGVTVESIR